MIEEQITLMAVVMGAFLFSLLCLGWLVFVNGRWTQEDENLDKQGCAACLVVINVQCI